MIRKTLILLAFISAISFAQTNFVPVWSSVYTFLDKMTVKGIINSNEFSKPLSRKEIAGYLDKISAGKDKLNSLEKEELDFYLRDYLDLLQQSAALKQSTKSAEKSDYTFVKDTTGGNNNVYVSAEHPQIKERWHLFSYSDSLFQVSFNPIFGLTANNIYKETQLRRYWGFSAYGNITKNFSFQMDFRDNWEKGDHLNKFHQFSPDEGPSIVVEKPNSIEYNMTNGAMLYSNDWLTIGGVKQTFNMGSGYRGQLIMSSKAPSFPAIYMKLNPVKWIQFYYMHGWLLSRVLDSANQYLSQVPGKYKEVERGKYIALHAVQINPYDNVSVSLGETTVYSDIGPYWGYFIPFLMFRSVEHMFVGDRVGDVGNNGSMFLDASYLPYKGLKLYGSFYIDEFSLTGVLKGDSQRNQTGYTIGSTVYDYVVPNLLTRIEYTKIMPWVYSDWVQTQTYKNADYLMGHYIGQNADQFFIQFEYQLKRGLNLKLWGEIVRQGGMDSVKYQYMQGGRSFLYGLLRKEKNIGVEASYEFMHDLIAKLSLKFSDVTDEDKTRTPSYMLGKLSSFGITVNYGM
jgi:hypothetical protein